MSFRKSRSNGFDVERMLRDARPPVPEALTERLSDGLNPVGADTRGIRQWTARGRRPALAAVMSTVLISGLGVSGELSYAATGVGRTVGGIVRALDPQPHGTPPPQAASASDQYRQPPNCKQKAKRRYRAELAAARKAYLRRLAAARKMRSKRLHECSTRSCRREAEAAYRTAAHKAHHHYEQTLRRDRRDYRRWQKRCRR